MEIVISGIIQLEIAQAQWCNMVLVISYVFATVPMIQLVSWLKDKPLVSHRQETVYFRVTMVLMFSVSQETERGKRF